MVGNKKENERRPAFIFQAFLDTIGVGYWWWRRESGSICFSGVGSRLRPDFVVENGGRCSHRSFLCRLVGEDRKRLLREVARLFRGETTWVKLDYRVRVNQNAGSGHGRSGDPPRPESLRDSGLHTGSDQEQRYGVRAPYGELGPGEGSAETRRFVEWVTVHERDQAGRVSGLWGVTCAVSVVGSDEPVHAAAIESPYRETDASLRRLKEEAGRRIDRTHQLADVSGLAESIVATMSEGILVLASEGRVAYANGAAIRLLELGAEPPSGSNWRELFPRRAHPALEQALGEATRGVLSEMEVEMDATDGEAGRHRWLLLRLRPLEDRAGTSTVVGCVPDAGLSEASPEESTEEGSGRSGGDGVPQAGQLVIVMSDITRRKKREIELRELSMMDEVTRLPNRRYVQDRLEKALAHAERSGLVNVAVLLLDLDDFKAVNNTYGHAAGDRVLREIGGRLARWLRRTDTVARFGGDEFLVVLEGFRDPGDVPEIARRLSDAVEQPVSVGTESLRMRAGIGLALYPDQGTSPQSLIDAANRSTYRLRPREEPGQG